MKKILAILLMVCLMLGPAAQAEGIGRVIQDDTVPEMTQAPAEEVIEATELSGWLGASAEDFKTALSEMEAGYSKNIRFDETENGIASIMIHGGSYALCGYGFGEEFDAETMTAAGWEQVSKWYEGGTLDYTFTKKVGGAVYKFRLWSDLDSDSMITYLNLSVDNPEAHRANVEAGETLMPVEEPAE